jgi:hypothetical protein
LGWSGPLQKNELVWSCEAGLDWTGVVELDWTGLELWSLLRSIYSVGLRSLVVFGCFQMLSDAQVVFSCFQMSKLFPVVFRCQPEDFGELHENV